MNITQWEDGILYMLLLWLRQWPVRYSTAFQTALTETLCDVYLFDPHYPTGTADINADNLQ